MNKQKQNILILVLGFCLCTSIVVVSRWNFQNTYEQQVALAKTTNEQTIDKVQDILDTAEKTLQKKDVALPAEGDAYASVSVERISFTNTVYYGDTDEILNKGIGHYMGSKLPGEGGVILLAGHNGTEFYQLRNVKKEDIVKLHTSYGEYTYQIYDMKIMEASDFTSDDLISDKETLIMYCCYPFDELGTSQRYFVYASYISGPKLKEDAS